MAYTYLIGWKSLDRWYYGVSYKRGCSPDDLWTSYFTSSDYVRDFIAEHGQPDVIEVRECGLKEKMLRLEDAVLRRLGAVESDRWLNRGRGGAKFFKEAGKTKWSEEARKRFSERRKGLTHKNKGRPLSESHKAALRGVPKRKSNGV